MAEKRKINVKRCNVVAEGSTNGKGWTLYGVEAEDEFGIPVEDELKCFANLRPGLAEYELERRDHPEYGTSYTIKAPQGQAQGQDSQLAGRVEALEEKVTALAKRVYGEPAATADKIAEDPPW